MALLVTVSELQDRFRRDCGLPAFLDSTNITTTDALDYVKRSAQKLAGLVDQHGASEQYLTTETELSTTAGVNVVSLPANTMNLIRLSMAVGDRDVQLEVASLDEWSPEQPGMVDYAGEVPKYRVIGNTVTLYPTPQSVSTLRVYYTVGFTVTATSDVLSLRPNWDEFIVANCCVLVRNRQEKMASEFLEERDRAMQAILTQIRRDKAGVRQVRDVRTGFFDPCPRGRRRWWF